MSFWNLHHILLTWKCTWIARACMCVCVCYQPFNKTWSWFLHIYVCKYIYIQIFKYVSKFIYVSCLFWYFKYILYLHQNFNILFARQQFFAGLSTFLGSPNTAVFQHKCCHVHMLWNPPFWQLYSLFKGVPQHEKTPTIAYKGSSLQFPKIQSFLFLQISYSETPPFSQKFCCAVFAHINTEPSHLCKFQSFCFTSKCKWIPTVCVTNHLVRHISKNKALYIFIFIYIYFNIPTGGQQFFPSVFVPSFPHTTHIFLCKTLVVICACCGTTLFHKGSFFSRQFHGIEEKHCLQRLLPKYRLCFRNHTLFWRKGKTTSKRTKQTKNERYRT